MIADEDSIEVYLTSPSDLAAFRKTQLNDIPAIQKGTEEYDSHHFEGSPPSSSNPPSLSASDATALKNSAARVE